MVYVTVCSYYNRITYSTALTNFAHSTLTQAVSSLPKGTMKEIFVSGISESMGDGITPFNDLLKDGPGLYEEKKARLTHIVMSAVHRAYL